MYYVCKSPRSNNKNGIKEEGSSVINELRILIQDRIHAVTNNPRLKEIGRWTQSTVFYYSRPILIGKGYRDIDNEKRKYITGLIKRVCQDLGYKRHELGIIAAERAQLYFKGQTLGVGFDQLEELMKKGTDLLVIEKEGVADVLEPFADQKGITILNSRGFLTEYATELSELAKQKWCNIATLTDLDSSGLLISSNLPNAYRIGVDFKTPERLELFTEDVEEDIVLKKGSESDNHIKSLKKGNYEIPFPYRPEEWREMVSYIDNGKRIEIDSVLKAVGNEEFWDFIIKELDSIFPNRDYNRSINVPEYVPQKEVDDLFTNIKNIISEFQADERHKVKNELRNTKGFLNIKPKENEIEERLRSIVEDNPEVQNRILEEIKKFSFDDNSKKSP